MPFHNTYHFYPCLEEKDRKYDVSREDFLAGQPGHVTHDRYVEGTYSGQIECRLTAESPIFVGGLRTEGDARNPATAQHFRLKDKLAIPGSSLRGMISSLGEAASNSALRVLLDEPYSFRRAMDPAETLSAIGMIVDLPGGAKGLYPLALPTLNCDRDGIATLPREYQRAFPVPLLKVYVGNRSSIRQNDFSYRTITDWRNVDWHAMRLAPRTWLPGYRLADDRAQHRKPDNSRRYLLAQLPLDNQLLPRRASELRENERAGQVYGVMRVLGCWGNRSGDAIPAGKKHELFLPFPTAKDWPKIPIPQPVIDRFHALCDERTRATFARYRRSPKNNPLQPFEPLDTRPERYSTKYEDEALIRVRHGDLVYFRPNMEGTEIAEIAFSAIWRGQVKGTTYSFFPQSLLPFRGDPERPLQDPANKANLTPADLLFGFVEDFGARKPERTADRQALALASRVRFRDAELEEPPQGAEPIQLKSVTLKVQDSPKLPCPSLYFKSKTVPLGEYIAKRNLDFTKHAAQGRKVYLHHREEEVLNAPWKTHHQADNLEQKTKIEPIRKGAVFHFTVDVKNLSEYEMGLLLYALSPTEAFRHKIGLGKALGLGSVKLEVVSVKTVDRLKRYSTEGYFGEGGRQTMEGGEIDKLRRAFRVTMPPLLRYAIELLGDPGQLRQPVKPPMVVGQDAERETFRFFVANDQGGRQFLAPIRENVNLPSLSEAKD